MSFLIAKSATFIPSRTVSLNAWTSRAAKRARTRAHLQHSPDTSMRQDLPLFAEREGAEPTGVPTFPGSLRQMGNTKSAWVDRYGHGRQARLSGLIKARGDGYLCGRSSLWTPVPPASE